MELLLVLRVLLRRWWLVLIPVVIAAIFVVPDFLDNGPAVSGGFTTTIRYTAAQQLEAIPERDGDYQDVWLASELTVNALTEWVRTGRFKDEVAAVARQNGVQIDPAALAISSDNERSIGQIFISWPNEAELAVINDAVMTVMQTRTQDYFPQLGNAPASVTILDEPAIAPAPPALTDRFGPLVRLSVALLAGIGLAFLAEYLDPFVRRREDVEGLGLPVVSSIPRK